MRNKVFLRIVAKIRASGNEPYVVRVREGLTEREALDLEVALVSKYGRINTGGLLCNLTDGGEGVSGHVHNEETRSRMAALRKTRGAQGGGYRGVSKTRDGKWGASIEVAGKNSRIGTFPNPEDAARAYDAAAYAAWGEDCFMNFPEYFGLPVPKGRTKEEAMRLRKPVGLYKGVIFEGRRGKWQPKIVVSGKAKYPGTFATPEEAAKAYDMAAIEAWGVGNCYLNFPDVYAQSA